MPSIDSGKKMHRFKIKTMDVIQYLRDRDDYPELYKASDGFYKGNGCRKAPSFNEVFVKDDLTRMRQFYEALLQNYPDVLSVRQVAQFTGYGESSVAKWCSKQELKSFFIRQKFKIPKDYLLEFLVSRYFIRIAVKLEKHQKLIEQTRRQRLDDNCIIVD